MTDIIAEITSCTACPNHAVRTNVVPGSGNPHAGIMLIGEGPGEVEDRRGLPFQGDAGKNLDRLLMEAGIDRKNECYITNIVKCRPTKQGKKGLVNRAPTTREAAACRRFLLRQIAAVQPRVIVCIGRIAAQMLLETKASLESLMKEELVFMGIRVLPTFHTSDICLNLDAGRRGRIVEALRSARMIAGA